MGVLTCNTWKLTSMGYVGWFLATIFIFHAFPAHALASCSDKFLNVGEDIVLDMVGICKCNGYQGDPMVIDPFKYQGASMETGTIIITKDDACKKLGFKKVESEETHLPLHDTDSANPLSTPAGPNTTETTPHSDNNTVDPLSTHAGPNTTETMPHSDNKTTDPLSTPAGPNTTETTPHSDNNTVDPLSTHAGPNTTETMPHSDNKTTDPLSTPAGPNTTETTPHSDNKTADLLSTPAGPNTTETTPHSDNKTADLLSTPAGPNTTETTPHSDNKTADLLSTPAGPNTTETTPHSDNKTTDPLNTPAGPNTTETTPQNSNKTVDPPHITGKNEEHVRKSEGKGTLGHLSRNKSQEANSSQTTMILVILFSSLGAGLLLAFLTKLFYTKYRAKSYVVDNRPNIEMQIN